MRSQLKIFSLSITISFLLIGFYSHAQQTPAWLFPIMFKDGNGERDTIYIGFDRNASINMDTVFGEKFIKIDTSKFNVATWLWADSAIKTVVWDSTYITAANSISFLKGKMPLTMYWYDTLFYSDSLPFPNLSPKPRGRGNLSCCDGNFNYQNCPVSADIIMTDMKDSLPWAPAPIVPVYSDSIVFYGDTSQPGLSVGCFLLRILPFDSQDLGGGITENSSAERVKIYPNPVEEVLYIETENSPLMSYAIYSIVGTELIKMQANGKSNTANIDVSMLPTGMYFIRIQLKNGVAVKKFIKQ